jgi:hypothetical protein
MTASSSFTSFTSCRTSRIASVGAPRRPFMHVVQGPATTPHKGVMQRRDPRCRRLPVSTTGRRLPVSTNSGHALVADPVVAFVRREQSPNPAMLPPTLLLLPRSGSDRAGAAGPRAAISDAAVPTLPPARCGASVSIPCQLLHAAAPETTRSFQEDDRHERQRRSLAPQAC